MRRFPAKFRSRGTSLTSFLFSFETLFVGVGLRNYNKVSGSCHKSLLVDHLRNRRVDEAREIFRAITSPNVSLCTIMITGFARNDRLDEALKLFDEMPFRDTVSWNSMINGCLACGDLKMAKKVFDEMPQRNIISWTTMVHGFMRFGKVNTAEKLFLEMPWKDVAAWNSMIHGYFSNFRVEEAIDLFEKMPYHDVISWTSMISGLRQNGRNEEALTFFCKMTSLGFEPSSDTLVCAATASANLFSSNSGIQIHGQIVKLGFLFDEFISASLVTLYSNCNQLENAHKIFNEKLHKNVAVWTALVTGYSSNREPEKALEVFNAMMRFGVIPNQSSLTSALNACCALEARDLGKTMHSGAIKLGFETDAFVGNSLIAMYSKCGGEINDAIFVFKKIDEKNIVSWNSVILGCANHGSGISALTLFGSMMRLGLEPDEITLTGLLSSCGRSGMLQKGRGFFKYFRKFGYFEANIEHYACMVDLLGRYGNLEEAEELVKNMPFEASCDIWLSILGSCAIHSDVDLAERAAKRVFEFEPNCGTAYVLLSNVYASAHRWTEVSRVRTAMRENRVAKQLGSSWVEKN